MSSMGHRASTVGLAAAIAGAALVASTVVAPPISGQVAISGRPDQLVGDAPEPPVDPTAVGIAEAIRAGHRQAVASLLREHPAVIHAKGAGGSTPLMVAALYGDAALVETLLDRGADPHARNSAGATPLMWALADAAKTRLLLERGADVNARSNDGRTPLLIASGRVGARAVVELLLDYGADPSAASSPELASAATPLREAAGTGDEAVLRLLLARGANPRGAGGAALISAIKERCDDCVEALIGTLAKTDFEPLLLHLAPYDNPDAAQLLIDRGAKVDVRDRDGRTPLMIAANSDMMPVETVRLLIEHGAPIDATSSTGDTALDFARRRGITPVVALIAGHGGKTATTPSQEVIERFAPAVSPSVALERSLPLLQRSDVAFTQKAGCISCHHNSLTAMTVEAASRNGFATDETIVQAQRRTSASFVDDWRERALQGIAVSGGPDTFSYVLVGMAAAAHAPGAATDAIAYYLRSHQAADGHWRAVDHRPPIESSAIAVTALSMRALQRYAPPSLRADYDEAIRRAAQWLERAPARTNEDRAFQLLGLAWAGVPPDRTRRHADDLLAEQRPEGGWGQLVTLPGDAYATGQALVALHESGHLRAGNPALDRAVRFLLRTQFADGSWHVRTRSIPTQPYVDSGFPHGDDRWISIAGTNWAAMALALTRPSSAVPAGPPAPRGSPGRSQSD